MSLCWLSRFIYFNAECRYARCHYAEFRVKFIVMLNVVMLRVFMLSVVMLSVVMLSVVILSVVVPIFALYEHPFLFLSICFQWMWTNFVFKMVLERNPFIIIFIKKGIGKMVESFERSAASAHPKTWLHKLLITVTFLLILITFYILLIVV